MLKKLGDKFFLVGVAHVLPKSVREVEDVITKERPDVVAVELCPSRYAALVKKGSGTNSLNAMRARPRSFLMESMLHLLQKKFSRQTGMPAGEEMLAALRHAKRVGARVELIDQPVEITLQRLMMRMGLLEKLRLFGEMLVSLMPIGGHFELDKLTEEHVVEHLLKELKHASPTSYEVLIQERDAHMASKLAMLLSEDLKVVGVVGAGHVPGIYNRIRESMEKNWRINFEYQLNSQLSETF